MKIAFVGATRFGLRCLQSIARLDQIDIVGIITSSPVFSISYRPEGVTNVQHADFAPAAARLGLPLYRMRQHMKEPDLLAALQEWAPDWLVVAGWYHMLPRVVREIAPALGLHASLLPDYSGGAPLVWALIEGRQKTGVSLFQMDDGVDSGPLLGQSEITIDPQDTIATVYARAEEAGIKLLLRHLPEVADGTAVFRVQDESRRRIMPQRSPKDGRIDWNWPAQRIYDFARAQTRPYPGAFALWQGMRCTLWSARMSERKPVTAEPRCVQRSEANSHWAVACGDGLLLEVVEAEWESTEAQAQWKAALLNSDSLRLDE